MATCFVIMGFGEKTDFETGRKLDLDKTYKSIIKPAVEEAGLKCIRADDVQHSGVIDTHMYQHLFSAEVVVADLSTSNSNAFYELGVRHALRPFSTVVIAEKEFRPPFDVNHVLVRTYEHLGKAIDFDEVIRFRAALTEAIRAVRAAPETDSPVYTYLMGLQKPVLGAAALVPPAPGVVPGLDDASVGALRALVEKAKGEGNWALAQTHLKAILTLSPGDTWGLQQFGLATYKLGDRAKDKDRDLKKARDLYLEAKAVLLKLNPAITADAETLGLWGALLKRLCELEEDVDPAHRIDDPAVRMAYLDEAIHTLQKGFLILNDYYNGINLAYLLDVRAARGAGENAIADRVTARRVREKVADVCDTYIAMGKGEGEERYWVYATAEEAWAGLADDAKRASWAAKADELAKALGKSWMRESTEAQIGKLKALLEKGKAAAKLPTP